MSDFNKRVMWGTTALHKLGDISRENGDFCYIEREEGEDYVGAWLTGFGFFNVKFPKNTTRDLTAAESEAQAKLVYEIV